MKKTKDIRNVTFRQPRSVGIKPVWNKDCKVLMVGSIAAEDGMKKGFYYASSRNQFWTLLDIALNIDPTTNNSFTFFKEQLKNNYNAFSKGKISKDEFDKNKININNKFINKLLENGIAICDIFQECYFNNGSSMDIDIILDDPNYPYKTYKELITEIIKNSQIKTVITNSIYVYNWFKKLNIPGIYTLKKVISPSPMAGPIYNKTGEWKNILKTNSR